MRSSPSAGTSCSAGNCDSCAGGSSPDANAEGSRVRSRASVPRWISDRAPATSTFPRSGWPRSPTPSSPSKIVLCDEATAVLSETDAEAFLDFLVKSRNEARGAIVYVTHRLSEVLQIADRITVLRDGKHVGTFSRGEVDRPRLIALMTKTGPERGDASRDVGAAAPRDRRGTLEVRQLGSGRLFDDVSLTVESGAIVGLAGVCGCRPRTAARCNRGTSHVRDGWSSSMGRRSRAAPRA